MRYRLTALLCLTCFNAQANVIQYVTGISYSNPAELFKIKKNEFILGGTGFYVDAGFTGKALNFNSFQYDQGVSHSRKVSLLPFGRIASRINDTLVFGVDVTQPFHSNLDWGNNSFTRYAAIQNLLTDVDVSPRLALSATKKLKLGAGLNFNFLKNNESNWALPTGPTTYATLINRTAGFGVGFNAGLYYLVNQTNFLGAAYFSRIKQNTRGTSLFDGSVNNALIFDFSMPATTLLTYVHIFNKDWLTSIQAFHTEWTANQYVRFLHTAARPPVPKHFSFTMQFDNSWAFQAAVRHQQTKKLGLTLVGMFDDGPEQDEYRSINFPSDKQYFIGLVGDYHFNERTSIELLYGRGFSNTIINNKIVSGGQSIPFNVGKVRIHADVIDLRLKIQV